MVKARVGQASSLSAFESEGHIDDGHEHVHVHEHVNEHGHVNEHEHVNGRGHVPALTPDA